MRANLRRLWWRVVTRVFGLQPARVAKSILLLLSLAAALPASQAEAGCGDYVFDRLHPQVLQFPGLTLYRQPDHPSDSRVMSNHWQTGETTDVLRSHIGQPQSRYSSRPAPCNGPNCQQGPETPTGQMVALPSLELSQQPINAAVADHRRLFAPEVFEYDQLGHVPTFFSQFSERLYRPPS